jgi:hypothetical protein
MTKQVIETGRFIFTFLERQTDILNLIELVGCTT